MNEEQQKLLDGTLSGMDQKGSGYKTLVIGVASRLRYKDFRRAMIPVLLNEKFKKKLETRFKKTVRELYNDAKKYDNRERLYYPKTQKEKHEIVYN